MHIALATCQAFRNLNPDDRLVLPFLQKHHISADTVVWDDPSIDWNQYDAVILRTTWDYHQKFQQFLDWIADLENQNIPLWNPPDVIRRNINKRYLIDFQKLGIATVSTIWIPKHTNVQLSDVLHHQGWKSAIIKPDVSASAYRTWHTDSRPQEECQLLLSEILRDSGALIQEFRDEIYSGEWSILFFQKQFSHAVIKSPASGDFRVQEELGGIVRTAIPSGELITQAEKILHQIDQPLLYARVDGIVANDEFILMELELIEPCLFLNFGPYGAENFARSIAKVMG